MSRIHPDVLLRRDVMEKISLPTRTISRRGLVVVPVALSGIFVMLAWIAVVLNYHLAGWYMKDFRSVVLTGRNIVELREGEVEAEYTLFEAGGKRHALAPDAVLAFERLDRWHPEMRYLFARALWREYNGRVSAEGITAGAFVQKDLPAQVVTWLHSAVRGEPTNRFYRATLAGVLERTGGVEAKEEVDRLLTFYPPQNSYGQIRTAEMLVERNAPKRVILTHYCRALELVSTEMTSGLLDTSQAEGGVTARPALGPTLVARAVSGMLTHVGTYESWAPAVPDYPETHWLLGRHLAARGMAAEADMEYDKVVTSVTRRLDVQGRVSTVRSVFEMLFPVSRPDYTNRFLMDREIGFAAEVLRAKNRLDEAVALRRTQIARMPREINARVALGEMLLGRAAAMRTEARDLRDRGEVQKAAEADAKADDLCAEVDRQVSEILAQEPRQAAALSLRARIPGRTPVTPTP
ncbi:MAG TPA: hypothetical protein VMZ92_10040 [Planctomycetota bacterium]|nr:hypothetical protein [Planctomycetota bacterium]